MKRFLLVTIFLVISSNCLFLKSDFTNFVALFCKRLRTFRATADIPVSIYDFCSPIFQVCNNMHIFELESILMHFSTTLTYLTFHFGILQCKSFWIKKSYHAMRSSINYILKVYRYTKCMNIWLKKQTLTSGFLKLLHTQMHTQKIK